MFILRHGGRYAAQTVRKSAWQASRAASRVAIPLPSTPPPVPVIETCPSPTCQCRDSPPDLDIERETNLNGSMAAYAEQILLCSGKADWKSKIEDEEDAGLLRQLRKFLVRGGKYVDPYHNVLLTNSSFASAQTSPTPTTASQVPSANSSNPEPHPGKDPDESAYSRPPTSAFLLPSFQFVPSIPTEPAAVEAFIKAFVLPNKLHKSYERLSRDQQNLLLREPERQRQFAGARRVDEILVLICGHGGRDDRCGKLGPVLKEEFQEKLQRQNIRLLEHAPGPEDEQADVKTAGYRPTARVGTISHIGGHKWAGNVIIYIPPSFTKNLLAGKGIWYGRVGPEHVEGIVSKTIIDGKVIKDLFRGAIDRSGEIIRL
ncbi:Putative thioredoxin-like ferredoxin, Thioredoxin-like superfamily [Septoria linicola]|uniref:Altered inheritance of mitochondria protein 32 n=1 Tax=Septoria linicola TaxID=215465 RepID=A0A9Q9ANY6_9PEZI|nr:putative thioredoxin-like ferredoxin, Thioredoxin-like superfamily [Septoria linicola]USW53002.1 Putative thioredoxin-like ferredoxin, Thioredoxin-like superfamily [Septoria linicola]